MRYPPEHRERIRQKILTHAGRMFRKRGYHGVGIDRIMASARLTRGGFYGYFRSKADLFAQVLSAEPDFNRRMRSRVGSSPEALRREALALVAGYLDPANRERVGTGCDLASLSVDAARAPVAARAAYTARFRELVSEFERGLEDPEREDPRALAALASCVGGLVLARAVDDDGLAARLLEAAQRQTRDRLVEAAPGSERGARSSRLRR